MAHTPRAASPAATHPVDRVPPTGKLLVLAVQHVLAFYAGAVVVPLVIASGLGLDNRTLVHLINADLFTCGIASIIQSAGIGKRIGVRLPLVQGSASTGDDAAQASAPRGARASNSSPEPRMRCGGQPIGRPPQHPINTMR